MAGRNNVTPHSDQPNQRPALHFFIDVVCDMSWGAGLGAGNVAGHSFGSGSLLFGARGPLFGITSIPQGSSPGHISWPETEHHMKVTRGVSAPSGRRGRTARFRPAPAAVISPGSLSLPSVPYAAAHAARHQRASRVWIIASFPVTTVPARGAGRLGNKPWILLHSTWCFSTREVVRSHLVRSLIRLSGVAAPSSSHNDWQLRDPKPGSSRSPIHDAGSCPLFRHRAASPWREGACLVTADGLWVAARRARRPCRPAELLSSEHRLRSEGQRRASGVAR